MRAFSSGTTLKPMITASEASAKCTSASLIPPTGACKILTLTSGWSGFFQLAARVERIVHGLHVTAGVAAYHGVPDAKRAALDHQFCDHSAALVQFGLQAGADGLAQRIGGKLLVVGNEQQHLQKL